MAKTKLKEGPVSHNDRWINWYNLAKKYYEYHGNLLVNQNYRTKNGYEEDNDGKRLGNWINYQRNIYESLEEEKKELLKKIGFILNVNDYKWEQMYELSKKYYEYYGNLLVPINFKTKDGYTYCDDGKNLRDWIITQRSKYPCLEEERILKLEKIEMVWNIYMNQSKIHDICFSNNIRINKNRDLIYKLNYKVMQVKIKYLLDKHIPLVDKDGKLHEIFKMSDINMQLKYDVSLNDLFMKYDDKKVKTIKM